MDNQPDKDSNNKFLTPESQATMPANDPNLRTTTSQSSQQSVPPAPQPNSPNQSGLPVDATHVSSQTSSRANNFFQPRVNGIPYASDYLAPAPPAPAVKSKKSWYKRAAIGIIAVVIIVFGVLLATNSNIRAFIFRDNLTRYTFVSKNNKYRVLFYRDSSIQNHTLGSSAEESIITSPIMKQYSEPVIMIIQATHNVANSIISQVTTTSSSCDFTFDSTEGFSVYIPALNTKANFCGSIGLVYYSYFGINNTEYFVQVQEKLLSQFSSLQAAEESSSTPKFLSNRLKINDLKTIVASLEPVR